VLQPKYNSGIVAGEPFFKADLQAGRHPIPRHPAARFPEPHAPLLGASFLWRCHALNPRTILPGRTDGRIIRRMNRPTTRDLFSHSSGSAASFPPGNPPSSPVPHATAATSSPRHILPSDLTNAIRRLEDRDLDRLLSAILTEQKRRGRNIPSSDSPRKRQQVVSTVLTSGKLNAVRGVPMSAFGGKADIGRRGTYYPPRGQRCLSVGDQRGYLFTLPFALLLPKLSSPFAPATAANR
jgi:hypothetical protein